MTTNSSELYALIQKDEKLVQTLFRQALQDPQGALQSICDLGEQQGLPVTQEEVKTYLANLGDENTKQWLVKARGGL